MEHFTFSGGWAKIASFATKVISLNLRAEFRNHSTAIRRNPSAAAPVRSSLEFPCIQRALQEAPALDQPELVRRKNIVVNLVGIRDRKILQRSALHPNPVLPQPHARPRPRMQILPRPQ